MGRVHSRPLRREDRAGDPMEGLVNMFDLGIVLALAFLVAALQSLHLANALTAPQHQAATKRTTSPGSTVTLKANQHLQPLAPGEHRVKVSGAGKVGSVYRLPNGELVYVAKGAKQTSGGTHKGSASH